MTKSNLGGFTPGELEKMLETIELEMKETRKLHQPGQTPEYWQLVAEAHAVREELATRGIKLTSQVNLPEELI